jgi:hypothetical protein
MCCEVIEKVGIFYQVEFIKKNHFKVIQYALGGKINVDEISKESIDNFLCDLYKNHFYSPSYFNIKFYIDQCNLKYEEGYDFILDQKMYKALSKSSDCEDFELDSGERILLKRASVKGKFFKFQLDEKAKYILEQDSYFSVKCDNIENYLIPFEIEFK